MLRHKVAHAALLFAPGFVNSKQFLMSSQATFVVVGTAVVFTTIGIRFVVLGIVETDVADGVAVLTGIFRIPVAVGAGLALVVAVLLVVDGATLVFVD